VADGPASNPRDDDALHDFGHPASRARAAGSPYEAAVVNLTFSGALPISSTTSRCSPTATRSSCGLTRSRGHDRRSRAGHVRGGAVRADRRPALRFSRGWAIDVLVRIAGTPSSTRISRRSIQDPRGPGR
jgi:hypothetical protein